MNETQRRLTAVAMAAERATGSAGSASVEMTVPSAEMAEISEVSKLTMTRAAEESAGMLETEAMAPVSKSPEFSSELTMSAGAWTSRMRTDSLGATAVAAPRKPVATGAGAIMLGSARPRITTASAATPNAGRATNDWILANQDSDGVWTAAGAGTSKRLVRSARRSAGMADAWSSGWIRRLPRRRSRVLWRWLGRSEFMLFFSIARWVVTFSKNQVFPDLFERFLDLLGDGATAGGAGDVRLDAEFRAECVVADEVLDGGGLIDVENEDQLPFGLAECFAAFLVDAFEGRESGVSAVVLELHRVVRIVGQGLQAVAGVGLVLERAAATVPIHRAE